MLAHLKKARPCSLHTLLGASSTSPLSDSTLLAPTLKTPRVVSVMLLALCCLLGLGSSGCDTGFGEPCTFPEVDSIQEACSAPAVENNDENGTSQSASATCALDNFPGCQTFLCLKYRGAQPYCSLKCENSSQCSGGVCCPRLGDCRANSSGGGESSDPSQQMSVESSDPCADGQEECYCIRQIDLER